MATRTDRWRRRARLLPVVVVALATALVPAARATAATADPQVGAGARLGAEMALAVVHDVLAPQVLDVVPSGANGLTVTWQPADDTTDFTVKAMRADDVRPLASVAATVADTVVTLNGIHVPAGQPVMVHVEADHGSWVATSRPYVAQMAPAGVATVELSAVTAEAATVTWSAAEHATAYDVQVSTDSTFTDDVDTQRVEARQLVVRGLPPATRQYVRVRATNGNLLGAFSPAAGLVTATTQAVTRPPAVVPRPVAPTAAARWPAPATGGATTLRIGTWNVCSQACRGYGARAPIAAQRLAAAGVDVFALQEAGGKKVAPVTDAVFGRGTNGYVRAAGGDKRGFVFFAAARYTQAGGGHVDLGDDRHMSWARLVDRRTGTRFVVAGIHLESGKDGVDGKRAAETRVALTALNSISRGLPTILLGDFNTGPHRGKDTPSILMAASGLADARTRSLTPPVGADYNTAHSWDPSDLSRHGDHIDRIMVSGQVRVAGWRQLLHLTGNRYTTPMVSDHNAVTADLVLPGA